MKLIEGLIPGNGGESKKVQALILCAVVMIFGDKIGVPKEQAQQILYLTITYILGQSVADFGKEKEKVKIGAAEKEVKAKEAKTKSAATVFTAF